MDGAAAVAAASRGGCVERTRRFSCPPHPTALGDTRHALLTKPPLVLRGRCVERAQLLEARVRRLPVLPRVLGTVRPQSVHLQAARGRRRARVNNPVLGLGLGGTRSGGRAVRRRVYDFHCTSSVYDTCMKCVPHMYDFDGTGSCTLHVAAVSRVCRVVRCRVVESGVSGAG